jgi:hypothetical protein
VCVCVRMSVCKLKYDTHNNNKKEQPTPAGRKRVEVRTRAGPKQL